MSAPRPDPFSLVFGSLAAERFPRIRAGLAAAGHPAEDRDGFLLLREVAELLQALRPEEGVGAAMAALVALVHHAYLFWADGRRIRTVGEEELAAILRGSVTANPSPRLRSTYVQLPSLRVWGAPLEGQPVEPLDGWFLTRSEERLDALGVFGLSPGRPGLTAVEVSGSRPATLERLDGSPLFSPTLAGGARAGLASLAGQEELLELVWRAEAAA